MTVDDDNPRPFESPPIHLGSLELRRTIREILRRALMAVLFRRGT